MSKASQDEPDSVRLDGWVAGVGALQREMLDFVAGRLEKDSHAIREAMASGSVGDALSIQQEWLAETVRDYLTESTMVVTLLTRQGTAFPQFGADAGAEEPLVEAKAATRRARATETEEAELPRPIST